MNMRECPTAVVQQPGINAQTFEYELQLALDSWAIVILSSRWHSLVIGTSEALS